MALIPRHRAAVLAAALAAAGCDDRAPVAVSAVTGRSSPDYGVVRIAGLDGRARQRVINGKEGPAAVHAVGRGDSILPATPLAGTWRAAGSVLEFRPRFPPQAGLTLWVRVDTALLAGRVGTPLVSSFELDPDRPPARATRLLAIHPVADTVPENLLRFYLEFSTPMEPGQALQRIRLVDDRGAEVMAAFLDVSQELWDPEGRRLTLLFDPGRVKRGIRTNLEKGRPLAAGRRYRLEVAAGWRDRSGNRLDEPVTKAFVVAGEDVRGPDPSGWTLRAPEIGSRDAVSIAFGEPLDHALAGRLLAVQDEHGEPIAGRVELDWGDRVWRFLPDARWLAGRYQLVVSPELEDLAGNRPGRNFDLNLEHETPAEQVSGKPIVRWFEPRAMEVASR